MLAAYCTMPPYRLCLEMLTSIFIHVFREERAPFAPTPTATPKPRNRHRRPGKDFTVLAQSLRKPIRFPLPFSAEINLSTFFGRLRPFALEYQRIRQLSGRALLEMGANRRHIRRRARLPGRQQGRASVGGQQRNQMPLLRGVET